jgi:hypothetical protein
VSDRFEEEVAMLVDARRNIRSVEGPQFSISMSEVDRVLDERNDTRTGTGRQLRPQRVGWLNPWKSKELAMSSASWVRVVTSSAATTRVRDFGDVGVVRRRSTNLAAL